MAISKSIMQLTGSLANVSMYKLHGSEQVVVRMKGGPTRNQIKTKPQFEKLRQNENEWAGCTRMGRNIRLSFKAMNRLEDYPVTGTLNGICKQIQKMDTEGEPGRRAIRLSKHKNTLLGFPFSSKQTLESVLKVPFETTLDRATGEAHIELPEVDTGMYLYNFRNLPYYRIIANLGGVCDSLILPGDKVYSSPYDGYCDRQLGVYESDWMPAVGMQPALHLTLSYPLTENPIPEEVTLLLCLGIEFGKVGVANIPTAVKYAGSGKIVRVG
ncbi:MAG: hypothetical protein Q8904_01330 [Bacteroidota bacterium]|nr:hypothetical protein [Bacteroidota bacterium]